MRSGRDEFCQHKLITYPRRCCGVDVDARLGALLDVVAAADTR